jgi:aryl-alcohol dehydrogenase-like predicted oxidoreductase
MRIRQLGNTGLRVSEICLGTMTFGNQCNEKISFDIMDVADAHGVNFFDTADVYPIGKNWESAGGTESIIGNWIKERGARERIVLATKCRGAMGPTANDEGLSRKHVISACEASLKRLGTDYIDLYQLHWPDTSVSIEETLRALDDLVRAGKVRYIGCSNYPAWQISDAIWTSKLNGLARFASAQPRYNVLFRMIEDEILPLCRAHGVGVIAYNPLAGGMLTGRYRALRQIEQGSRFALGNNSGQLYQKRYWKDEVFKAVDRLSSFLEGRGKTLTHAALAWVLAQDGITSAILGASSPAQLEDSLKGVELRLDDEETNTINDIWFDLPRERDPQIARR